MITLAEYMGRWLHHADATPLRMDHAVKLIVTVNELMQMAMADGVEFSVNPSTKSQISGHDFGGFRPQNCPIGAGHSSHKEGRGIDLFDPRQEIDAWCLKNSGVGGKLEQCRIFIEDPLRTDKWSHWTDRPPLFGHRVFEP